MRVQKPRRSLQCDFYLGKVNEKTANSTKILGFCGGFIDIWPFLACFTRFGWV
jgi:hypothetical protein